MEKATQIYLNCLQLTEVILIVFMMIILCIICTGIPAKLLNLDFLYAQ